MSSWNERGAGAEPRLYTLPQFYFKIPSLPIVDEFWMKFGGAHGRVAATGGFTDPFNFTPKLRPSP